LEDGEVKGVTRMSMVTMPNMEAVVEGVEEAATPLRLLKEVRLYSVLVAVVEVLEFRVAMAQELVGLVAHGAVIRKAQVVQGERIIVLAQ
jgi:hypothetical protein